jgi:TonB family protein
MRFAVRVLVLGIAVLSGSKAAAQVTPAVQNAERVAALLKQRYPEDLQQLGIGGTIKMRVRVIARGTVDSMEVATGTGVPALDAAALSVARGISFSALSEPVWTEVSLVFEADRPSTLRYADLPVLTNREAVAASALDRLPDKLRKNDVRAQTSLLISVDSAGRPQDVRVLKANCVRAYDDAARRAVAGALFTPAATPLPQTRQTIITFTFDPPDVVLRLPGEGRTPAAGSRIPPADFTPYTAPPKLRNGDLVSRELQRRYPSELRAKGIGGTVQVWLFVDEKGDVKRRSVRSSSGNCALDQAALEVTDVMYFEPATLRGQLVKVWVDMPIIFRSR